ncbi:MAG: HNH endonuclease signature motif containing protein [Anaerolineales bacterium]
MSRYISKPLRQRVIAEARGYCAYCRTAVANTGARFVIDHIIPEYEGGQTAWENLCLACHTCNEFKGIVTETIDPMTESIVPLFHPKNQRWLEHFTWSQDGSQIIGLTPIGRATILALKMNHPDIVFARLRWAAVGWHPPQMD